MRRIPLLFSILTLRLCFAQQPTIGADMHLDTAQRILIEKVDLSQRLKNGEVDIPRLREGGVNVPFFALWVPTYYHGAEAVRRTLDLRDAVQTLVDAHPKDVAIATTAAEVERITGQGRIALVLTIEGGHQIDNDLGVLRVYQSLGIRSMTLTHFRNNDWADASTDKLKHNGLTEFGKQVVREMNRLGMLVDLSHVSDKTFYDALAVSTQPVIVSHSSCRAISNMPRNVTDDMLRALARNDGVIGINLDSGFLNEKDAGAMMASISANAAREPELTGKALDEYARRDYFEDSPQQRQKAATVEDAAAHIDHAVKVAGIAHVAIGSDYDGGIDPAKGLEDISRRANLVAALKRKGYSDSDIAMIMGGNVLRVMRAVLK